MSWKECWHCSPGDEFCFAASDHLRKCNLEAEMVLPGHNNLPSAPEEKKKIIYENKRDSQKLVTRL